VLLCIVVFCVLSVFVCLFDDRNWRRLGRREGSNITLLNKYAYSFNLFLYPIWFIEVKHLSLSRGLRSYLGLTCPFRNQLIIFGKDKLKFKFWCLFFLRKSEVCIGYSLCCKFCLLWLLVWAIIFYFHTGACTSLGKDEAA
jgi:hypothetical protein